jgi:hypothetical protein
MPFYLHDVTQEPHLDLFCFHLSLRPFINPKCSIFVLSRITLTSLRPNFKQISGLHNVLGKCIDHTYYFNFVGAAPFELVKGKGRNHRFLCYPSQCFTKSYHLRFRDVPHCYKLKLFQINIFTDPSKKSFRFFFHPCESSLRLSAGFFCKSWRCNITKNFLSDLLPPAPI